MQHKENLISPNDGEEFQIVWGVQVVNQNSKKNEVPVLAFEKRGKDGKRHRYLRGRLRISVLLTEEELKAAVCPPGYTLPF